MKKYLVVYENEWLIKEHTQTNKIGDTIQEFVDSYKLNCQFDKEKLNSNEPASSGTFGPAFYDIPCENEDGEYAGRFMIFDLEGENEQK